MTKAKLYNLNKSNISQQISNRIGFSKLYSDKITDNLIIILKHLIKKSDLKIKNFGTFKTLLKNKRIGLNPKTKEKHEISSRKSVAFSSSKKLKQKLNNF